VHDKVEGPFDLIELAGQLKYTNIDAETSICREGKKDWFPFRDLPEFATVRQMSIEVIARHLEEKARAELLSQSPKKPATFPWIIIAIALFVLGITAIGFLSFKGPSADTLQKAPQPAVQDSWVITDFDSFSIQCPVMLKKGSSPVSNALNYEAAIPGVGFVVTCASIAGDYHNETNAQLFNDVRDRFLNGSGNRLVSERDIPNPDYQARELIFSGHLRDVSISGRMRIVITQSSLYTLIVFTGPGKFSDENMDRFLNSFKPH